MQVWHAMWLAHIDDKIDRLSKRQAEQERGRRAKPRRPEWIVEFGIGVGHPPCRSTRAPAT
jgi:hypothetical protein